MPLVRIDLCEGKSEAWLRAMSDAVHRAMIECFQIPARDRFQVITQQAPSRLIYDPNYFDIDRDNDFVLIQVFLSAGRTTEQKQAFYERVTARLQKAPGLRPQDVMIVLTENHREDWSFGNGEAQYVTRPREEWK